MSIYHSQIEKVEERFFPPLYCIDFLQS